MRGCYMCDGSTVYTRQFPLIKVPSPEKAGVD